MCNMLEVMIFLLGESYWREVDRRDGSENWWVTQGAEDYKILFFLFVTYDGGGLLLVVTGIGVM